MKIFCEYIIKKILKKPLSEEEFIVNSINAALCELNRAKINFDMVVGADNVELAILELNTAEKRYRNLIKEAKSKGINRFYGKNICGLNPSFE